MSGITAMEVNTEARRILAVSINKLYCSRSVRGGLRLHRSLLLSSVMRSARDIYHSSRESEETCEPTSHQATTTEEAMETSLPEPQPEPQSPAVNSTEPAQEEPEEEEDEGDYCETSADKENLSPAARQSRKRRGKASAAPDFLPVKRARLEPGEERYAAASGSCCRALAGDSLNNALSLNLNRAMVPAF